VIDLVARWVAGTVVAAALGLLAVGLIGWYALPAAGLAVGYAQWWALRRAVEYAGMWVVATAGAWVLAHVVGGLVAVSTWPWVFALYLNLSAQRYRMGPPELHAHELALMLAAGGVAGGLLVGAAQWWVLRDLGRARWWWVAASAVGGGCLAAGGGFVLHSDPIPLLPHVTAFGLARLQVTAALGAGLAYAALTAAALAPLVRSPPAAPPTRSPTPERHP
jgi:hypothetical protein